MYVGMGYFESHYGNSYPFTGNSFFYRFGDLFGKELQREIGLVVHFKQIVAFGFGDYERMAFGKRIDIEESEIFFVFGYFVTRDFSRYGILRKCQPTEGGTL